MLKKTLALAGLSFLTLSTSAALYDRGNGLIYDDVLNITWAQDVEYTPGTTNWEDAVIWAGNLNYGGFDDWRLPSISNNNVGVGELEYMFYNNLGYNPDPPQYTPRYSTTFDDAITGDTVRLNILVVWSPSIFWHQEDYEHDGWSLYAPIFSTQDGRVKAGEKRTAYLGPSWAVRDGDVAQVPIPGAVWLFCSALIGLAGIKRKK